METCREIRKQFSPWENLEVLDSSKQTLNQVSYVKFVLCYIKVYFNTKGYLSFIRNATKQYIPYSAIFQSGQECCQKLRAFKAQYKLDNHLEEVIPL